MNVLVRIRALAAGARRLFTPYRIPAELRLAMDELEQRAAEAREARQSLDTAMVGAQGAIVANILSSHQRLRGPRDV